MAQDDDDFVSDFELGRRDALAEVRRDADDGRVSHAEFVEMRSHDPQGAAELLAAGKVKLPSYVTKVLDANRRDRERWTSDPVMDADEYEARAASMRGGGFPA